MIISASRRTDIPTYYSQWFINRIRAVMFMSAIQGMPIRSAGSAYRGDGGRDRFLDEKSCSHVGQTGRAAGLYVLFQFTLNSYGADIEGNLPSKNDVVIPAFCRLSDAIGPDRVIWRYDPIFLSETYTMEYHLFYYEKLARRLSPYTKKCTISFLDFYRNTEKNLALLSPARFPDHQKEQLAKGIAEIAHSYGLKVDTCAEGIELQQYGSNMQAALTDVCWSACSNVRFILKKIRTRGRNAAAWKVWISALIIPAAAAAGTATPIIMKGL